MGFVSRLVAELDDIRQWNKQLSFTDSLSVFRQMRFAVDGVYRIHQTCWGNSMYLRNNVSDKAIFRQVFFELQYMPAIRLVPHAKFIVDAGANIGMASRYFHLQYPDATIVAIEPEGANFSQLCRNVEGIKQIHPLKAGVWYKPGKIAIQNAEAMAASFMVADAEQGLDAVTIPMLLEKYGEPVIDILKLDIESAEKELLEHEEGKWLSKVKLLIIELHDEMKAGCGKALINALQPYDFTLIQNHENLFIKFHP